MTIRCRCKSQSASEMCMCVWRNVCIRLSCIMKIFHLQISHLYFSFGYFGISLFSVGFRSQMCACVQIQYWCARRYIEIRIQTQKLCSNTTTSIYINLYVHAWERLQRFISVWISRDTDESVYRVHIWIATATTNTFEKKTTILLLQHPEIKMIPLCMWLQFWY